MHHGRIWRLTYDGMARDRTPPRMLNETPAQLVAHLSHPNGWWRDTAQQLLVLKQDKSVVPALQTMVRTSKNQLARFHALWTLEGLGALTAARSRARCSTIRIRAMRIQALRASETLYKAGDRSFASDYRALAKDTDTDVVIQAMLTMNVLKVPDVATTVKAAMDGNKARGVQFVADRILNPPQPRDEAAAAAVPPLTPSSRTASSAAARSTPSCASRATATTGAARRRLEPPAGRRSRRRWRGRHASTAIATT